MDFMRFFNINKKGIMETKKFEKNEWEREVLKVLEIVSLEYNSNAYKDKIYEDKKIYISKSYNGVFLTFHIYLKFKNQNEKTKVFEAIQNKSYYVITVAKNGKWVAYFFDVLKEKYEENLRKKQEEEAEERTKFMSIQDDKLFE